MNSATPQEEQAMLRAELQKAQVRLEELGRAMGAIDVELEGLTIQRKQHQLLEDACSALEELGEMGAAALFWGDGADRDAVAEQIRAAHGRLKLFRGRLEELEGRRESLCAAIQREEENAELVEDDLYELELREQRRKLEWIVEREISERPHRYPVMPWSRGGEDDRRFRKALAVSLLLSLLLGLLLPQIDLPIPESWEVIEVPDRLARLIREERPLPPPPPPSQEPLPQPDESKPEQATETASEATPKQAAESKGILAFREKFSGLAKHSSSARLGAKARISGAGDGASGSAKRSMVATRASGSSGGIDLGSLSRDVGGGGGDGIEGVQVTRATSTIGGGGESARPTSGGPSLGRTDEEIQIVFDRHKAALYRLYNRELRRDPTLKGQMVLRIRIEPDGSVSLCELQASDMDAPQLSAQVVDRVRTFDFGAKEGIPAITILYPIDFLPAT